MHKMDFGCGNNRHPSCDLGVDSRPCDGATIVHSGLPPLPLEDGSCDYIFTNHTLEHLEHDDFRAWMDEFGRLLCPGGVLEIIVPHFSNGLFWSKSFAP